MVSMIETSNSTHNDTAIDPVVPKPEPLAEGSISSAVSTPDPEGELLPQDVTQTQKRKGGRKPVRKISFSLSHSLSVFMFDVGVVSVLLYVGQSGAPQSLSLQLSTVMTTILPPH